MTLSGPECERALGSRIQQTALLGRRRCQEVADVTAARFQENLRGRGIDARCLTPSSSQRRRVTSRTVVLRGEAGIDTTALLEYVAANSRGGRVVRAIGVESEMELPSRRAFASVGRVADPNFALILDSSVRRLGMSGRPPGGSVTCGHWTSD